MFSVYVPAIIDCLLTQTHFFPADYLYYIISQSLNLCSVSKCFINITGLLFVDGFFCKVTINYVMKGVSDTVIACW